MLPMLVVGLVVDAAVGDRELASVHEWRQFEEGFAWFAVTAIAAIGGLRAYAQNLVLKYNTALTLAAVNILVQALTIVLSIIMFNKKPSALFYAGIVISLVGYGVYTAA